jgi:hypothetical protein
VEQREAALGGALLLSAAAVSRPLKQQQLIIVLQTSKMGKEGLVGRGGM